MNRGLNIDLHSFSSELWRIISSFDLECRLPFHTIHAGLIVLKVTRNPGLTLASVYTSVLCVGSPNGVHSNVAVKAIKSPGILPNISHLDQVNSKRVLICRGALDYNNAVFSFHESFEVWVIIITLQVKVNHFIQIYKLLLKITSINV